MHSCHPPRSRRLARLFASSLLVGAVVPAGAGAADLTIRHSIATPVTAASPCTAEPKGAIYSNTAFDPAGPETNWFGYTNLPSTDDLVPEQRAGVNADFCIGYGLQPDFNTPQRQSYAVQGSDPKDPKTQSVSGDDQKDIAITLPRGVTANLKNIATCTEAQFGVDGTLGAGAGNNANAQCPTESLVGDAVARISVNFLGTHVLVGGVDREPGGDYPGAIWRLASGPNELGRLGVQLEPAGLGAVRPSKFTVRLVLAGDGSGRVVAKVAGAPRVATVSGTRDIYVEAIWMRMWGAKADHPQKAYTDADGFDQVRDPMSADFMETPTQCSAPVSADIALSTYGGARSADPSTYVPTRTSATTPAVRFTGCDQLPFAPTVSVTTAERTPATPTAVDVRVHLAQDRAGGRLPALLKDAAVTLPQGLELGAQVASDADGLVFCTPEQFAAAAALAPATCPDATAAGEVRITSPLIETPLVGKVFLGAPGGGRTLPDLYLEAALPGASAADAPRVKLVGATTVDDEGRITATFQDAPPLRFDDLRLSFPGGAHALFSTPQRCGTTTGRSLITPDSGAAARSVDASLTIDQGCGAPFAPTTSVEPIDAQAGKKAASRIVITRPAASPWIERVNVHLPAGFLADLNAASECGLPPSQAAACPEGSRIGTMYVLAGAGDQPLALSGAMYLMPRSGSDVAGAVLVTRAKIGDLDLGDVTVPGRIVLRPTDAGLDFIADVPLRHRGLALQLQRIEVVLDRPGFGLNPSSCGPLAYSAEVTGDGGEVAAPGGSASYWGCAALPFRPTLSAKLTGDNTPGGHPGMYVRLDSPEGDAAMKSAAVTLPQGVAAALPNVQNPCLPADFEAVRCAASTRVGRAVARVSIAPEEIPGDVFLIKVPGKVLPGLGLSFTGRYAQRVTSTVEVNKDGRLVTNFPAIPDLPLRALTIAVDSGPRSPLQLPADDPCANGSNWDGAFVGQGGQVASARSGLQCAAPANARLSAKQGLTVRLFDFGGRHLEAARATLPTGWRFDRGAARSRRAMWVRMKGATPRVRLTSRTLTATANTKNATDLRIKITSKVVRPVTRSAKRAKRVDIGLRLTFTDGTIQTQTLRVRAR
ncbi:MAG: hypothetical protein PGN13_09440 [Patulibacter minatonensis]